MTLEKSKYDWVFKYKLHHLLFWTLYHFSWWTFYEGGVVEVFSNLKQPVYQAKFFSLIIFQALGVYFNLYYLIPKYMEKGRILVYVLLVFLTIIGMSLAITAGYAFGAISTVEPGKLTETLFYFFTKHAFPSSFGSMTLGMSIKLAKNWFEAKQREQVLEKEKLETELKFLRSQFNPHFLFNTINSIFVLINKDSSLAKDSLAKFSELLRYQLYECNEPQIPLSRELDYINSFIELEKLRHDQRLKTEINYPEKPHGSLFIAPFVLMTFVENAFKHVSKFGKEQNWIRIDIRLEEGILFLDVSNTVSDKIPKAKDAVASNGLGLKNVKRRLELIYPAKYELTSTTKDGVYKSSLLIDLKASNSSVTKNLDS